MRVEIIGDARTIIYALCEPLPMWETGPVRYVGKTARLPGDRVTSGIRIAKRKPRLPLHYWLRKQVEAGLPQHIIWLESVPEGQDWAARERYWIKRFRDDGCDLLNLTEGGEGLAGHKFSAVHKARIADALRTGDHFNCTRCGSLFWRKRSAILRGETKFCGRICANKHNKGGRNGTP